MRSILKGGVWKNTQDEILKAAVMKYGLNQWSRISSLLNRKSAAQCKARWYEWLDPSIKKTPWTREEEERLLHLAKMFPCQWRTISNVIGRTPAQCINHYQKLLDRAQGREPDQNDPRHLRPGEIDPNPETKPARPDPIDMDDDEKETLQEARARIGNTRGKKSKRKQREKQLEVARRLAQLQKRKEMRAMGIDVKKRIKIRGTDYNSEIPFQRNTPSGRFVPTKNQTPIPDQNTVNIAMQQLSQSRRDTTEKKKRESDIKKFEMMKDLNYEAADAKIKRMREKRMLDDQEFRAQLKLPSAVINENEFSEIQKLTSSAGGEALSSMLELGNLSVNRGSSSIQSFARTPSNLKDLMSEAKNAYLLINAPTPLLAGKDEKASYEAFKPQDILEKSEEQTRTANPLLSSMQRAKQEKGIFKEPLPIHNRRNMPQKQQELLMPEQSEIDKSWEDNIENGEEVNKHSMIEDIKSSIFSLPQPKNQKAAPTFDQTLVYQQKQPTTDIIQLIHNDQLSFEVPLSIDQIVTQTLSKQSNLPTPLHSISGIKMNEEIQGHVQSLGNKYLKNDIESLSNLNSFEENNFSKMILRECDRLILNDQEQGQQLSDNFKASITKKQFKRAQELIKEEMGKMQGPDYSKLEKIQSKYMYFPSLEFISQINEKTSSTAQKFEAYQERLKKNEQSNKRLLKKIDRLQGKLNECLGPFYKKEIEMREKIQQHVKRSSKLKREKKIFNYLQREEERGGVKRIQEGKLFLHNLRAKEEALQNKYKELRSQLE